MQVQANQGTGLEALFKRGFYARLQGDLDKASEDLNAGMQLFALHHPVLPYATLNCSIRGLPMVGTESRNRNVAQMGQAKHRQLEGYCGSWGSPMVGTESRNRKLAQRGLSLSRYMTKCTY